MIHNVFDLQNTGSLDDELFQTLAQGSATIERIVSTGHSTPEGEWYDQEKDEWVILLQGTARILFENDNIINLKSGDYILIKAHNRHRVEYTSTTPQCVWLAIHGIFS